MANGAADGTNGTPDVINGAANEANEAANAPNEAPVLAGKPQKVAENASFTDFEV